MALKLMGKKRGMMQRFDDKGNVVVCTVIEIDPNIITQIKSKEKDGYNAIQLGFDKTKEKLTNKPQIGHFKKAGVDIFRHLAESRVDGVEEYSVGQAFGVSAFAEVPYIDATATSKGKGYQGVMKKHNFSGGPAAHGSGFHRHAGSTGMRSTPGRCLPGGKRASQMGNAKVTTQSLKVVEVDEANNILIVEGSVPGPNNGLVYISQAKKKAA